MLGGLLRHHLESCLYLPHSPKVSPQQGKSLYYVHSNSQQAQNEFTV